MAGVSLFLYTSTRGFGKVDGYIGTGEELTPGEGLMILLQLYTLHTRMIHIYIYIHNMILFYLFSQHKIYGRFETLVWENWRITPLYYILVVICVELAFRFFLDPSTSEILVNNNQDVAPPLAISVVSQIHEILNVEPWYYPVGKSS